MNSKSPFLTPLLIGLFALVASNPVGAAILVSDSFSYPQDDPLNGASGGTGWATPWTAVAGVTTTSAGATFTATAGANANELAYRTFSSYSGDILYIAFTITATNLDMSNDFFALWLDSADNVGANATHSASLLNAGMSNGNLFARATTNNTGTAVGSVTSGTTYQFVLAYEKTTPGSSNNYNKVSIWINPPDSSNPGTPDGSWTSAGGINAISAVGFRGVNNDAGDIYYIDTLKIATAWNDVVPIPEPGITLTFGIGLIVIFHTWRHRRGTSTRRTLVG